MPTIALEMERLRNPYSGLGQYCLHLGHALPAVATMRAGGKALDFACLVPRERMGEFGKGMAYKAVRPWHKVIGPSFGESLWHCMHQDSEYMPRSRQTPLAITIHDLNFLDRPDYSEAKKSRKLKVLQQKVNRAAGLVYISGYVRQWVHEHLKIPAGTKESVIYNGGAMENAAVAAGNRQTMPNAKGEQFLFSIGIHPKKNYHALLPILKAYPAYKWVIAGPDSRGYRGKIEQEAAKFGVAGRITFCGPVGDAEKRRYYENCAALLFPSLSEGFGLPVVEAMSLGKPVFLSNRTSLPEIGGNEAYYFADFEPDTLVKTFEAGMKDFESDPQKPARMMSWSARYSWQKAAAQYLDFYQELLAVDC